MIAVVNYGSGNVQAIGNIYGRLGIPFALATRPGDLLAADKILLPGVGAFDQAMGELEQSGMRRALDACVLEDRKPILGICVGMQLLARTSEEGSIHGLGWLDAVVKRFDLSGATGSMPLPHMGWNTVDPVRRDPLFENVDLRLGYYFLHSYYFACATVEDVLAVTHYGEEFTSAVRRGNIYGVQFHPEKSHHAGVQVLKNFALFDDRRATFADECGHT
jgi:glutamine amidotransferase